MSSIFVENGHPEHRESAYERQLDRNYSSIGENCSAMIERKVSALLAQLRHEGLSRPLRILDVGCGVGLVEERLTASSPMGLLAGIDLNCEDLSIACGRQLPSCLYAQASGMDLPFADASFDAVFTICTLHHVPPAHRARVLAEMHRVLKPSGWMFAFEHNPYNPLTRYFVSICKWDHGCRLLAPRELLDGFRQLRLKSLRRKFLIFFPSAFKALLSWERRMGWLPMGAQYFVAGQK